MNIKYKITLQDYINFNKFHQKNIYSIIIRVWSYFIFLFAILTLNIVLIFLGLVCVFVLLLEKRTYKTYYYSKKELNEEINLKTTKDEITIKTIYSETTMKPSEFYKIKESKEYYFLYISKLEAIILPKRYIEENQREKLSDFFNCSNNQNIL